ncbi:MAG TPA: maltose ABC transporter permease MalF, partial [Burkholderiaceae bacterium]|nr:maltose ABC transporter permease MalF [Burkholderiaceae bacterium]
MAGTSKPGTWGPRLLLALAVLGVLYLVTAVYALGETLLAGTLLVLVALSLWIYSSPRTYAFRYLFPGIAAALIFVVFPMLYTIAVGFTNYSSRNLLPRDQAERYFLEETYRAQGSSYAFTLHAEGPAFRLRLEDSDNARAFVSAALVLAPARPQEVAVEPDTTPAGEPVPLKTLIALQPALRLVTLRLPEAAGGGKVRLAGLREFAPVQSLWQRQADGSLHNQQDGRVIRPNLSTGFYQTEAGEPLPPGFQVNVG